MERQDYFIVNEPIIDKENGPDTEETIKRLQGAIDDLKSLISRRKKTLDVLVKMNTAMKQEARGETVADIENDIKNMEQDLHAFEDDLAEVYRAKDALFNDVFKGNKKFGESDFKQ